MAFPRRGGESRRGGCGFVLESSGGRAGGGSGSAVGNLHGQQAYGAAALHAAVARFASGDERARRAVPIGAFRDPASARATFAELLTSLAAGADVGETLRHVHGDVALDAQARRKIMPRSTLAGDANLLVLPNIDAANIAYNLLKTAAGGGIAIGPVLLGAAKPVHILTPSATVRRIVNMTALTVADANAAR